MRFRIVLAVVVLAAVTLAQDVSLTYLPKVGTAHHYSLKMEAAMFGDSAVYTSKVTEKVVDSSADRYTVEYSQSDYKVTVFGDEAAVADKDIPKSSTVFSPLGDVLEVKGDLVNDSVYRMANLKAIRRPDKSVKVGDTWTRELKTDAKTGVVAAKATYKVESEEKVGQQDALLASFDFLESEGNDPAHATGKVWFSKIDGTVLKLESTWSNAPVPGFQGPMNATVTYERID